MSAASETLQGGLVAPIPERRIEVLGGQVDVLTMDETVARCEALINGGGPGQHMALNTAKLVAMQDDPLLRDAVNRCEIITADGQGIVLATRLLGGPRLERVTGVDLMDRLVGLAARQGYGVYLLGAEEAVLEEAVAVLRRRHPGLVMAGARHGYFRDDEVESVCEDVRRSNADMLFVGMSSPRKELFLNEHLPTLGVPFAMGVGGSIDVVAGKTRRAPASWQHLWMEWLYRLLQEPRRMFPRYARSNTRFALMLVRAMVGRAVRR